MNTALIFAGGTGQRMNSKGKPKQFLELYGKPIIVYTLEWFEKHIDIDDIIVVCLKEWIEYLEKIIEKYGIKKVKWIVEGGETCQLSIFNGLKTIYKDDEDRIVLIHDGVRPIISEKVITDNIETVKKCGNAITTCTAKETVVVMNEEEKIIKIEDRKLCRIAKAPQSFYLKDIYDLHIRAKADGIKDSIDSATLMTHYGYALNRVEGSSENIKITTPIDYYVFKAICDARENSQIFGISGE